MGALRDALYQQFDATEADLQARLNASAVDVAIQVIVAEAMPALVKEGQFLLPAAKISMDEGIAAGSAALGAAASQIPFVGPFASLPVAGLAHLIGTELEGKIMVAAQKWLADQAAKLAAKPPA